MSLSNDRREVLRKRINKQKGWAAARSGMSADELRTLLDMADERDRYREAVKQAKTELWRCRSDMAVMLVDDDGGIPDEDDQQRLADIEQAALACSAALEGK